MLKISIKTIPHHAQRYNTQGDYFKENNHELQIRVSDQHNQDYEFLVALHELVEYWLCQKRGIKVEAIDKFDMDFENKREQNNHDKEPGDDPKAPYRKEHRFAENIERLVAQELGIHWDDYYNHR